ncbi:MAG: L-threonylcarbamoyladenylate synthase [Mariprofundaceae bacterium]
MALERLRLHPDRPNVRLVRQAVLALKAGRFVLLPTETTYIFACRPDAADAIAAIRALRGLDEAHLWSVLVPGMSAAGRCVRLENEAFRVLRRCLPGPYTFILPASSLLPRRIFGKRRDLGIRMPDHPVASMLLEEWRDVLLCTTAIFAGESEPAMDPDEMERRLRGHDAVLLDAGWGGMVPTTVVDLCASPPALLREGAGPWSA